MKAKDLTPILIGAGLMFAADKAGVLNKIGLGSIGAIKQSDLDNQLEILERYTDKKFKFDKAYNAIALADADRKKLYTGYLSKKEMHSALRFMILGIDILQA